MTPFPWRRCWLMSGLSLLVLPLGAAAQAAFPVEINGQPLNAAGQAALRQQEARTGPVPPGRYWYDPATGAAGTWGGPMSALLPPGLPLGGPLPAEASGGGHGRLTGVFINGRELHPLDVAGLSRYGPVQPGRYRWDAQGQVFTESGAYLFNFNAVLAAQARGGGGSLWRPGAKSGEGTWVGKGCARVSQRRSPGDPDSVVDTYVGCD